MQFSVENMADNPQDEGSKQLKHEVELINGYVDSRWEKLKMDSLLREVLLDGAETGDMCFYTYWDSSIDTGNTSGVDANNNEVPIMGDFVTECIDGSNVMFGNPSINKPQPQPYIVLAGRKSISELKAEAKANGMPKEEINKISSDNEVSEQVGDRGKVELDSVDDNAKCLYLIKLWKKNGKVFMRKSTKSAVIQKDTDTGLTLYPIAWANWDLLKNSYHGQAEVTGLIPNQIMINQMFAMIAYYMRMAAFGKVVYDKSRISSWNNAIGAAIGVEGDIQNVVKQLEPGQMNNFIMTFIEKAIAYTKEIAGVNDAALGNMSPRNTSAIVALQKQTAIPLENIKSRMYQLIEDLGLIWMDFIVNKYEVERMASYTRDNEVFTERFKGSSFKNVPLKVKIDVGTSGYWSEIANIQTLDNLLEGQKISLIQYLERVPNGIIPKANELIAEKQAEQEAIMQQQQQAQQMSAETQQLQSAKKQLDYEKMAQFMETLAPEVQKELKAMPDAQMEQAVMQLMDADKQGMLNAPQTQ